MAQRDLVDLITNQPITALVATDVMHVGRPGEANAADRDKGILVSDLFNSLNSFSGVFGIQNPPTSITATPQRITGYAASVHASADASGGTITIPKDGTYTIEMLLSLTANDDNGQFVMTLDVNGNNAVVDAVYRPNQSSAPFYYILKATTMRSLGVGDVVSLELNASAARTATWHDAMLAASPTSFT